MTLLLLPPEPPWAIDLAAGRDYALADATKRWPWPWPAKTPRLRSARL